MMGTLSSLGNRDERGGSKRVSFFFVFMVVFFSMILHIPPLLGWGCESCTINCGFVGERFRVRATALIM